MPTITATTIFSNNIMIRSQVTLARAVTLIGHAARDCPAGRTPVRGALSQPGRPGTRPDHLQHRPGLRPAPAQPTKRGVYERDGGQCAYCGKPIPFAAATLDHVVPQSLGGPSTWENLVNCCARCNQRKGGRTA